MAAQELNRKWIGIDQSDQAIKIVKKRLNNMPANLFSKLEFELLEQAENEVLTKKIQPQARFFEAKQKIKLSLQPGRVTQ